MPFKKGHKKIPDSGIKKGEKQKKTLEAEAIREFLVQEVIKEKGPLIKALIAKGKKGDVQALREILDRVLGKVKETIEMGIEAESLKNLEEILKEIAEAPKKKSNDFSRFK